MSTLTYPGAEVFDLKDTHGLPLSVTFAECEKAGAMIDWVGLIEAARQHGWWDFQTYDAITEAFTDSGAWPDKRAEILRRIKVYMVEFPHPMTHDTKPH